MTFTFSDNHEVDYSALGMCPVCGVRFTHGCKHSNTLEAQEWLAAYAAAESSRDNTDYCIAVMKDTAPHPVNEMQDIEREIDKKLGNPLFARREAILAAFREEPLTADQAHALINELAEIETRSQEVIDPTGKNWFDFDNVKEIKP